MTRLFVVATLSASALLLTACPPKAKPEQLPPAGLAGAPATGQPLTLPGAGVPVATPSGGTPSTQLPPGHPPIPGANSGGDADSGAMPAGHPAMPGAMGAMPGAGDPSGGANVVLSGPVLETMDVTEYTYMRVKTGDGDTWVAVTKTPVAVGDVVTVNQSLVMTDFHSKSLNRTFPKLVMGMMVGAPKKP